MKGVFKHLVESGAIQNIKTVDEGIELVTTELEGKGKNRSDAMQIKQISNEVRQLGTVEKVQTYVFNSFLKFNGLGVIK